MRRKKTDLSASPSSTASAAKSGDGLKARRLAGAVGVILLLASCATRRVVQPSSELDTSRVLRIVGRLGTGHACPVDNVVLTAGHNISPSILR